MTSSELYTLVAKAIKQRLGNRSHMTVSRSEITEEARRIANNSDRKVNGSGMETALAREGLRIYPSLGGAKYVRVLRLGTVADSVVNLVAFPTQANDKELRDLVKKSKNEWDWGAQPRGDGEPPKAA